MTGERRLRREQERRMAALAEQEGTLLSAAGAAAPAPPAPPVPPVQGGDPTSLRRPRERDAGTTTSLPVIRPAVRPPTPEQRPASAPENHRHRQPSWDDTLTGRIPVIRERLRDRPATPRHSASSGSAEQSPPPRDRTLTALLLVVLVVAVVIAGGVFVALQDAARPAPATPAAGEEPGRRTLLVVLDDGAGTLTAASLLSLADGDAVSILVPAGLQVDALSADRSLLAHTLSGGGATPAQALSDLLRVRIDGTLRLPPQALAETVDAVGGVVVDVDREVLAETVLVPAGQGRRLDGAEAAAFAGHLAPDEPEEARLARVGAVLAALVAALPADDDEVRELLREVAEASTTLVDDDLTTFLGGTRDAALADGLSATVLPVTPGTAGDERAYRLDEARATTLVDALLPGAGLVADPAGVVRVLVRNGDGTPGLSDAARQRLQAVGLRFVGGGNADTFDVETSQVLVPSGSAQATTDARRVAAALGLPAQTVGTTELETSLADVVVVLGADFADDVADRGVLPRSSATP